MSQGVNQLTAAFVAVTGGLVAIAIATRGTFLLVLVPCALVYYKVQELFRRTSTQVTRFSKLTRSPIFADFSMSLAGAPSIRAYKCSDLFLTDAMLKMDENNAHMMMIQLCFCWLTIRLDAIGAVVFCFIVAITVATKDFVSAGWLGLALSFAVEITSFLKQGVRFAAQVEGAMASVERVMEYTNDIDQEEAEFLMEDLKKDKEEKKLKRRNQRSSLLSITNGGDSSVNSFTSGTSSDNNHGCLDVLPEPSNGLSVTFEGVVMGYRNGPDVLKGLNFQVIFNLFFVCRV
jgi:ABC-type multidrug transport system fused ATPase/permease subunit